MDLYFLPVATHFAKSCQNLLNCEEYWNGVLWNIAFCFCSVCLGTWWRINIIIYITNLHSYFQYNIHTLLGKKHKANINLMTVNDSFQIMKPLHNKVQKLLSCTFHYKELFIFYLFHAKCFIYLFFTLQYYSNSLSDVNRILISLK